MTTHAELVAAVEKVQRAASSSDSSVASKTLGDTLAAILNLHTPDERDDHRFVTPCTCCFDPWPCPTVDLVVDALRKMGAL